MTNQKRWRLLVILVVILFFIEYSPLVIPQGEYTPLAFGLPYSLWLGILFATLVVFLTYIGSRFFMDMIREETDQ